MGFVRRCRCIPERGARFNNNIYVIIDCRSGMAPRHHALRESSRVQEIAVNEEIDWAKLATELGLSAPYGEYSCGSDDAQRALEQIIGEDALRAIVDYYVDCRLIHHWLARFFGGCGPGVRCAVGMRYSRVPKQSRTGEPPSSFCVWVADRDRKSIV